MGRPRQARPEIFLFSVEKIIQFRTTDLVVAGVVMKWVLSMIAAVSARGPGPVTAGKVVTVTTLPVRT